ncbi:MAG: carboxypeptidase regulatory-like domain-containing protein [Ignavibacteriaceae bacterium]|nr:carboxypeptidase regulatory-like domain-containing protein [Ignavibacteriaceae bacterium]
MKKVFLFLLLTGALLAQNTLTGQIKGKVIAGNTFVAGALVEAVGVSPAVGDSLLFTTISGNTGDYHFPALPSGIYYLKAKFNGVASQAAGPFTIQPGVVLQNVNLYLSSTGLNNNSVSGVVSNAVSNTPLSGALVKLIGNTATGGYTTTTNLNGEYRFLNIVPGSYLLEASAPGYQTTALLAYLNIQNGTFLTGMNLAMMPLPETDVFFGGMVRQGGMLTVVIPIPDAAITLFKISTTPDSSIFFTVSDSLGRFRFNAIPSGTYRLTAQKEGYITKIVENLNITQNTDNYIIPLEPQGTNTGGKVKGTVSFDGTNLPVAQAKIEFLPLNMPPSATNFIAFTGSEGRYEKQLPAGSYVISCSFISAAGVIYKEYYDNKLQVTEADIVSLLPGQIRENINFGIPGIQNPPMVILKGTVRDTINNPVPQALVTLWILNDSLRLTTISGPDGKYHFSLSNHPAMNVGYRVSAQKDGFRAEFYNNKPTFALADLIVIHGDTVVSGIDFSLEPLLSPGPSSISGFVYEQDGATPIANAFVIASKRPTGEILFTFSGGNGAYSFANVSPGGYYILFAATGFVPEFYNNAQMWEQAALISASGAVTGINGTLAPVTSNNNPGIVAGTVSTPEGQPLSEVYISVLNDLGQVIGYAFSDASGNYSVTGLAQGSYTVQASKVQFNSFSQNLVYNPDAGLTHLMNISLSSSPADIGSDDGDIPEKFALLSNYPNPFNPSTTIEFALAERSDITLKVYDLFGREIAVLASGSYSAGRYTVPFDGSSHASGVYIYKLSYGKGQSITRKMTLLK